MDYWDLIVLMWHNIVHVHTNVTVVSSEDIYVPRAAANLENFIPYIR